MLGPLLLGDAFGDHLPPRLPDQIKCQTGMSNGFRKPSVPQICILLPKPVRRYFGKIARSRLTKTQFVGQAGKLNGSCFELSSVFPKLRSSEARKSTAKYGGQTQMTESRKQRACSYQSVLRQARDHQGGRIVRVIAPSTTTITKERCRPIREQQIEPMELSIRGPI